MWGEWGGLYTTKPSVLHSHESTAGQEQGQPRVNRGENPGRFEIAARQIGSRAIFCPTGGVGKGLNKLRKPQSFFIEGSLLSDPT
eukprot:5614745-Amphidinium_carterae.1